jgi:hypothetical protein
VAPVAPVLPVAPVGPVEPVAPVAPVGPVGVVFNTQALFAELHNHVVVPEVNACPSVGELGKSIAAIFNPFLYSYLA